MGAGMMSFESCPSTLDQPTQISRNSTGFMAPNKDTVPGFPERRFPTRSNTVEPDPGDRRPDRGRGLSVAWVSEELLAETVELWSKSYGHPISQDEALEILMNVKRLGELLVHLPKEGNDA